MRRFSVADLLAMGVSLKKDLVPRAVRRRKQINQTSTKPIILLRIAI